MVSGQQHAPAALYPRERPTTHFTGGWVGPRAGLEGLKFSSPPGFDPDRPSRSQSLYRLSYPAHSQGVPHVLWNSQVHDRVKKCLPLLHKLIQTNEVNILFLKMHLNLTLPIPPFLQVVSSFKVFLPNFLYALLTDSKHATCRANLIILNLIILIIDAQQKPWSSSFRSFLRYPLTSSPLGLHIVLAPSSRTPSDFVLPIERQPQVRINRVTAFTFECLYFWRADGKTEFAELSCGRNFQNAISS